MLASMEEIITLNENRIREMEVEDAIKSRASDLKTEIKRLNEGIEDTNKSSDYELKC